MPGRRSGTPTRFAGTAPSRPRRMFQRAHSFVPRNLPCALTRLIIGRANWGIYALAASETTARRDRNCTAAAAHRAQLRTPRRKDDPGTATRLAGLVAKARSRAGGLDARPRCGLRALRTPHGRDRLRQWR